MIMQNNFFHDKRRLKINLRCLKRRLGQKITENVKKTSK